MERIKMSSSATRLEFKVVREDWSQYRLDDGTILKVKLSPTQFKEHLVEVEGRPPVDVGFNTVTFKEPSDDDTGEPSTDTSITTEDYIREMSFEKIEEIMNIYDVPEKFIVHIRTQVVKVHKTSKFDKNGNRIYNIENKAALSVTPYPE